MPSTHFKKTTISPCGFNYKLYIIRNENLYKGLNVKIEIVRKVSYGKERFYPLSEDAKFMAEITGRPSFTRRQLQLFMLRGWKITLKTPEYDEIFGEDK